MYASPAAVGVVIVGLVVLIATIIVVRQYIRKR